MESKKINQLATNVAPVSSDLTIVGDPITGVSKKITLSQIANLFAGSIDFYANLAAFPVTGNINIIYCAKDTQKLYLWSGSAYVETFPSQAVLNTYQLLSAKGVANGYASLDASGKVPIGELPSSIMEYKGLWSAATNTPTLANGTGDTGDVYICSAAGSVNFGAGAITFAIGDYVIYSGTIWQRSSGAVGTVTSVGLSSATSGVTIGSSPVTTSGTITLAIATATTSQNGLLSSTDWATFNGKESVLTFSSPLVRTTNTISIPAATTSVNGYLASADFTTFNNKQNAITLTTTGTSGASTLVGATLNIPNYGSALTGYVPYTGATQDVDLGAFSLNGKSLHIKGTAGNGHLGLKHQSAAATGSANESLIYADSLGDLSWQNANLYLSKFITSANTANRSYTFPNANGTVALTSDISYPVTSVFGRTGAVVATNGDYTTAQVTEVTNLYFTDSRARLALSFVAGSGAYNSTTGVITIPTNNNQITNGAGYTTNVGTVTSVAATGGTGISITGSPITTSGTITITNSAPDQVVALTASTGISVTGTYPNFTITNTSPSSGGTVTSVAALTIGTSGTDLSSSVANSTTTPVITLNVPTASATNRGALSSADWTTFNSKQGTITLTTTGTSGAATFSANTLNIPNYTITNAVTGTGTTNYLPKFTGTSTIGNSLLYDNGTNVGIGTISPNSKLEVTSRITASDGGGASRLALNIESNTSATAYSAINSYNYGTAAGRPLAINESGGNVMINTTTDAGYKLDVNGTGRFSGTSSLLYLNNTTATTGKVWRFSSASNGNFYITQEGVVDALTLSVTTGAATFSSSVQAVSGIFKNSYYNTIAEVGGSPYYGSALYLSGDAGTDQKTWRMVTKYASPNVALVFEYSTTALSYGSNPTGLTYAEAMRFSPTGAATFISSVNVDTTLYVSSTATISYNGLSGDFGAGYTIGMGVGYSSSIAKGINMGWNTTLDRGFIGTVHNGTAWKSLILCPIGGDVYIGATANNNLYAGAATFSSSVTATSFFESSDSRLKTLIQDNYQTKGIASITPKLYTKNGKVELGYYAQDFVGILDNAISKGEDDMLSLSYREVHTAKIYALEQEIKELKAKLN